MNNKQKEDKIKRKVTKKKNNSFSIKIKNSMKNKEKENFSLKEVIVIMIFSIAIGIALCFSIVSIIAGKNYFKVVHDLDKVIDAYYSIVDNYYGNLDKNALIDGALEGMISSVGDSFTSYINTDETESFDEKIKGSYDGIGCSVITDLEGNIVVISVFENSPAATAGLEVGDIIIKVDEEDYKGKTSIDLADFVKESNKKKIRLTVVRNEEEKEITINLSKIEIPYVEGEIIETDGKKIGYISISLFASTTYKQFEKKLNELEKENINGLIIDVRSNSGGYLTSVTDICSMFLKKNDIIYQLEDTDGVIKKKDTTKEKRTYQVVVLINKESASASEILASAIKESYNGLVVGTNSYGKGTVQQTKRLLDGSMIKYTTQKWLTPNGNFINEIGVTPTNIVELNEEYYENPTRTTDNQFCEAVNLLTKETE